MFNKKRNVRECTAQMLVYDTIEHTYTQLRTKGHAVAGLKDHSAAVFGHTMIVYGGLYQNGSVSNEILKFDL